MQYPEVKQQSCKLQGNNPGKKFCVNALALQPNSCMCSKFCDNYWFELKCKLLTCNFLNNRIIFLNWGGGGDLQPVLVIYLFIFMSVYCTHLHCPQTWTVKHQGCILPVIGGAWAINTAWYELYIDPAVFFVYWSVLTIVLNIDNKA